MMRNLQTSLPPALAVHLVVGVLGALALLACVPASSSPSGRSPAKSPSSEILPEFLLGGIQINEPDLDAWLDVVRTEGLNTISVTNYARQGDWDSADLTWEPDPGLVEEMRRAKAAGLHVVLILRVQLDHAFPRNRFLWHGMIQPKDEATLAAWFARYREFALHWAEISQRLGVDALLLGSELNTLAATVPLIELPPLEEYYLNADKQEERREAALRHAGSMEDMWMHHRGDFASFEEFLDARIAAEVGWAEQVTGLPADRRNPTAESPELGPAEKLVELKHVNRRREALAEQWKALVGHVRETYAGPLGYAANFDNYQDLTFWDALDVIGINAYFPLRDQALPDNDTGALYAALRHGWDGVLTEIATFRALRGLRDKPVIFSELGYTRRANSTLLPWADSGFAILEEDGAEDGKGEEHLVLLGEEPERLEERALAVRALREAHAQFAEGFLRGLLYWKLSTVESHLEHEAFMLWLTAPETDPLTLELRRFLDG